MPEKLEPLVKQPRLLMDLTPLRHGKGEIVKTDSALKTMQIIRVAEDGTNSVTLTRDGDSKEYSYRMGDTRAQREVLARFHAALLTDPAAAQVLQERAGRLAGAIVQKREVTL